MDSSKLITLGAVGVGLWLLYEWLISQCETPSSSFFGGSVCGTLLGTSSLPVAAPISTAAVSAPVSTQPNVPAGPTAAQTLALVLTQAAQTAGEDPTQLNPDDWSYYYQQIPGKPTISPALFGSILTSLGLTTATRSTIVSAQAFAAALTSNGLSGVAGPMPFAANWVPAGMIHGRGF